MFTRFLFFKNIFSIFVQTYCNTDLIMSKEFKEFIKWLKGENAFSIYRYAFYHYFNKEYVNLIMNDHDTAIFFAMMSKIPSKDWFTYSYMRELNKYWRNYCATKGIRYGTKYII